MLLCGLWSLSADMLHVCRRTTNLLAWMPLTTAVPQGTVLESVPFNIFISDLKEAVKWLLLKLAKYQTGGRLIGEQNNMFKDRVTIWMDLERLEEWADRNPTKPRRNKRPNTWQRGTLFNCTGWGRTVKKRPVDISRD